MHVHVLDNQIGNAGAASLAEAIKSCTQLKTLRLYSARVRVTGGVQRGCACDVDDGRGGCDEHEVEHDEDDGNDGEA